MHTEGGKARTFKIVRITQNLSLWEGIDILPSFEVQDLEVEVEAEDWNAAQGIGKGAIGHLRIPAKNLWEAEGGVTHSQWTPCIFNVTSLGTTDDGRCWCFTLYWEGTRLDESPAELFQTFISDTPLPA